MKKLLILLFLGLVISFGLEAKPINKSNINYQFEIEIYNVETTTIDVGLANCSPTGTI